MSSFSRLVLSVEQDFGQTDGGFRLYTFTLYNFCAQFKFQTNRQGVWERGLRKATACLVRRFHLAGW